MHTLQKCAGDPKVIPTPPTFYQVLFVNGPVGMPLLRFADAYPAVAAVNFLNGGKDREISVGVKVGNISWFIGEALSSGGIYR